MFKSARLKLTIWYIIILSVITIGFSVVLYQGITNTTRRALRNHQIHMETMYKSDQNSTYEIKRFRRYQDPITEETIESIKEGIFFMLVIVDAIIIFVAGILGYFLAGLTLRPIEIMAKNQKRFIANAAHELKTPLSAIRLMLEVSLKDNSLKLKDSKEVMQKGIVEIDHINSLVQSLLVKSKYQSKNLKKQKTNVPLSIFSSINDVVNRMNILAKKKGTKINVKLDINKDLNIYFDKASFLEIITVLLDNAIKYSDKNSNINIHAYVRLKHLYIKVADNGVGISKEDLPFIFDRFYKADKSRSKEGFGLGLSIVKDILDLNDGEIKIKSTVNKGSVFTLKLPL